MIELSEAADLDPVAYEAVVYGGETVSIAPFAIERINESRACLLRHLATGVICYGVTTGLGAMSTVDLTAEQREALPRHTLVGRASATGGPLPAAVGRGALLAKLVQFLGGRSGVSAQLCEVIADRLNRGLSPIVPGHGHGAAGEIIALSHATQPLIGEGSVLAADGGRRSAGDWHAEVGIEPYQPQAKEGLSLISGTAVGPAFAWHLTRRVERLLDLADLVAATSIEGLGAPLEPYGADAADASSDRAVPPVMARLRGHLDGSGITRNARQAPVSYRVTPQVHAVAVEALQRVRDAALADLRANGDNPAFFADPDSPTFGRLVNSGNFHGGALAARVEAATVALVHLGVLAEKRLYRLLDDRASGLSRQLARRPGLDAGLITVHKAALDHAATLRMLAAPIAVVQPDSSFGQEDAQAMVIPALHRLTSAVDLTGVLLAHEAYVAAVAIDERGEQPSPDVAELHRRLRERIDPYDGDRSYGPDLDVVIDMLRIATD